MPQIRLMGTVPTFSFSSGSTDTWQVAITDNFSYMLWGDDTEFDNFYLWASNSANDPSLNQYENSTGYSGYVLSFWCKIITGTDDSTRNNCGCCLKDNDYLDGGGYCALYTPSGSTTVTTHYLTNDQFSTAEYTDYSISTDTEVAISDTNELGFEVF